MSASSHWFFLTILALAAFVQLEGIAYRINWVRATLPLFHLFGPEPVSYDVWVLYRFTPVQDEEDEWSVWDLTQTCPRARIWHPERRFGKAMFDHLKLFRKRLKREDPSDLSSLESLFPGIVKTIEMMASAHLHQELEAKIIIAYGGSDITSSSKGTLELAYFRWFANS